MSTTEATASTTIAPPALEHGTLVRDPSDSAVYLVEDGKLRHVADEAAFHEIGGKPEAVGIADRTQIEHAQLGAPVAAVGTRSLVVNVYTNLGANHHMWTTAGLVTAVGKLTAQTRTATFTLLGGFRGGVEISINDANGWILFKTPVQRYGVDGKWIGRWDRTDPWEVDVPADVLSAAASLSVYHFWADNWTDNFDHWIAVGCHVLEGAAKIKQAVGSAFGFGTGPVVKP